MNKVVRSIGVALLTLSLLILTGGLVATGVVYSNVVTDLPSLDELPVLLNPADGELLHPTRITDRSGQTILYTLENPGISREYLEVNPEKSDHFSPQLIRAVVAKLDPTFWENPGYTLSEWNNPEPTTIAERLVSDLLLWREAPSLNRNLRMRLLASQLVSRFGRTQVLEWYLNSAWFGNFAVGSESAARFYFNKSAGDLSLAESALLAVVIDAPALNPVDVADTSINLQREFLGEMAQDEWITLDEYANALREPLSLVQTINGPNSLAPVFTSTLMKQLDQQFQQNRLIRGGLVIQSTLDPELQEQLICTSQIQIMRLQGNDDPGRLADSETCKSSFLLPTQVFPALDTQSLLNAGVILNPITGEVLAYHEPSLFDGQKKIPIAYEPGSLLTPFAALAGFARGLSPATLQWDIPINVPASLAGYQNVDQIWHGAVSLREAIANDYLLPIASVMRQAGESNTWQLAMAMGLTSLESSLATQTALFSGSPVSMLDVAAAYGTLANSGVRSGSINFNTSEIQPSMTRMITTTTGRLLEDQVTTKQSPILSSQLAYLMNNILSDESARWPTLGYPNPLEIGQPAAVKLGTTITHQQVWTVGYTPERLVLIWMGDAEEDSPQSLHPLMSAGIWHALIKYSTQGLPNQGWQQPEGVARVKVCVPSGMLPSMDCPTTSEEIFLIGNEPTMVDTLFEKIKVNRETGLRATVFTEPTLIEERLFINVPANAKDWALESGLPVSPSGYDAIPATQFDPDVQISSPKIFSPVSGKVNVLGKAETDNLASWTLQIGEGINPLSWLQISAGYSGMKSESELAVWDTTGLNGLFAIRLTVVGQDQSVRTATIQVTVDNTPPQVQVTYPLAGQEIEPVSSSITMQAEIEDSSGIEKVEWYIDGKLAESQTSLPFLYLMPVESGKHTLKIIAVDKVGNQTTTNELEFTILK